MGRAKFFLFLFFFIRTIVVFAQDNDANNFFAERRFLFEVKQIDEFFERFNDDRNSFIRKYIKRYYPQVSIKRQALISTLFDGESKNISEKTKAEFIRVITQKNNPFYLDFYNVKWRASITTVFTYNQKDIPVIVHMRIEKDTNNGAKWMIEGFYCNQVKKDVRSLSLPIPTSVNLFINPMAHATNFIGLSKALENKQNLKPYLKESVMKDSASVSFLNSFLNTSMKFREIVSVKYDFRQIAGWEFLVEQKLRLKSINSGWLITALRRITDSQKLAGF